MDSKVTNDVVILNRPIYNGTVECPVDAAFNLPDYCPDIKRILKCTAEPHIFSYGINGDTLEIAGTTGINVLYVDDDGGEIASCEINDEFIQPVKLNDIPDSARVCLKTLPGYINCRAVSSRKLDIHGSFTISVCIEGNRSQSVITGAQGNGIEVKTVTRPMSAIEGFADKAFTVSEVLEMPQAKPPVKTILRCGAVCDTAEYKTMQNKIIVKGDLIITMLYCPDGDEDIQQMRLSLPVSRIIDIDGVNDNSLCDARLRALNIVLKPMADANNEMRLISCEARVMASVCCYEPRDLSIVTDAYSTEYELNCERTPVSTTLVCDMIKTEETLSILTELPDGIVKAYDVWCDEPQFKYKQGDNCIIFDITIRLCLLGHNSEGIPVYFEKELEGEYSYEINESGRLTCDADFTILDTSYSMSENGKLDLRLLMKISGIVCRSDMVNAISSLEADTQRKKAVNPSHAISLYFAAECDELWEIAKRYNTSPGFIMEENDLGSDRLDRDRMLVIPFVQAADH